MVFLKLKKDTKITKLHFFLNIKNGHVIYGNDVTVFLVNQFQAV